MYAEKCARKVENTAWEGDCLRRCHGKCREVRMEYATQGVCQGLPSHMSV